MFKGFAVLWFLGIFISFPVLAEERFINPLFYEPMYTYMTGMKLGLKITPTSEIDLTRNEVSSEGCVLVENEEAVVTLKCPYYKGYFYHRYIHRKQEKNYCAIFLISGDTFENVKTFSNVSKYSYEVYPKEGFNCGATMSVP